MRSFKAHDASVHPTSTRRRWLIVIGMALVVLTIAAAWRFTPLHLYAEPKVIGARLQGLRHSAWLLPSVIAVYLAANAVLFPNTVLNVAVILGLGTTVGLPCALAGSLTAAMAMYALGRRFGGARLRNVDSATLERLTALLRRGGVLGVALVRLLPIAPYGVVNVMAGAARVRPLAFGFGTLLGLLPGNLLVTAFGHQLRNVLQHPTPAEILVMVVIVLAAGIGLWFLRQQALRQRV